jgi:hypothetical protein
VVALIVGGVVLVGLGIVVGGLVGGDGGGDETTTASADDSSSAEDEATTTTERATTTTTQAPTTTTTLPGVADGQHLIPDEMAPGRWYTRGGAQCGWNRLSGLGGTEDQVIAADSGGGGPAIVDIAPSDAAFVSYDCGRWTPYAAPPAPATTFGSGDWAVRGQIVPGTYRAETVPGCYWERASGFSHEVDQTIDVGNPSGPTVVIAPSDSLFTSSHCGNWTKIG